MNQILGSFEFYHQYFANSKIQGPTSRMGYIHEPVLTGINQRDLLLLLGTHFELKNSSMSSPQANHIVD